MADPAEAPAFPRPAPPIKKPRAAKAPKSKATPAKRGRKPATPQRSAADQIKLMRALMKLAKQL